MKGKNIGYIRVSSLDQNPERQLEGVKVDRVFIDKASGRDANRDQLAQLLDYSRDEDHVFVHSMDRLARNLDDLRRLVLHITEKGAKITFIKEGLTFTGQDSPMATLMLSVMGAFAEFERSIIRERQLEGIEIAKRKGLYKGRKRALSDAQAEEARERVKGGESKAAVARSLGISRQALYGYLL